MYIMALFHAPRKSAFMPSTISHYLIYEQLRLAEGWPSYGHVIKQKLFFSRFLAYLKSYHLCTQHVVTRPGKVVVFVQLL